MDSDLNTQVRRQADRLRDQLAALERGVPLAADTAALQRVERSARDLRDALALLGGGLRPLVASAELGFMPGPALDAFVERHAEDWDKRLRSLAAGAAAVQQWSGAEGRAARRLFLVRGYLRGFAHLWRQHETTPADPAPGSPFFDFACHWLEYAGIMEDHEALIAGALEPGWRLA